MFLTSKKWVKNIQTARTVHTIKRKQVKNYYGKKGDGHCAARFERHLVNIIELGLPGGIKTVNFLLC